MDDADKSGRIGEVRNRPGGISMAEVGQKRVNGEISGHLQERAWPLPQSFPDDDGADLESVDTAARGSEKR
ncbi:MAG TPA: hypothetical protein P5049_05145 [Methanothrix sp.]|nr:hypothetical protein [Methanothrix sp.]